MAYDLRDKLVIGISSRALFDLEFENEIYDEKKYSFMDETELIIRERGNSKNSIIDGFSRTSTFVKNENDEWILDIIDGVLSISWGR